MWAKLCHIFDVFLKIFFVDLNKYNLVSQDYIEVLKNTLVQRLKNGKKSDVFKSIAKNQISNQQILFHFYSIEESSFT